MASRGAGAALRRDPELQDVLVDLERRLGEIAHIRTREYDDKLAVVEALAGPYALAFLYEIRRLDAMLARRAARRRKKKIAR